MVITHIDCLQVKAKPNIKLMYETPLSIELKEPPAFNDLIAKVYIGLHNLTPSYFNL